MTSFGIIFLQKKKWNIIKHAFSGSSGNSGGNLEEQGLLNSIPRGIGSEKRPGPRGMGSSGFPVASLNCTFTMHNSMYGQKSKESSGQIQKYVSFHLVSFLHTNYQRSKKCAQGWELNFLNYILKYVFLKSKQN